MGVSLYCRCVSPRPLKGGFSNLVCVVSSSLRPLTACQAYLCLDAYSHSIGTRAKTEASSTHRYAVQVLGFVRRVLPGLRQQPVVHAAVPMEASVRGT